MFLLHLHEYNFLFTSPEKCNPALLILIRHSSSPLIAQITPIWVLQSILCLGGGPQSIHSSIFAIHCLKVILFQFVTVSLNTYEGKTPLNSSPVTSNENKYQTEVFSWTCLLPGLQTRVIKFHRVKKKQPVVRPNKTSTAKSVYNNILIKFLVLEIISSLNLVYENICIMALLNLKDYPIAF